MFRKKKKNVKINLMLDSDKDGLSDFDEKYLYKTDPNNPDTDGDGLADGFEVKIGSDPRVPENFRNLFIPHAGNGYHPLALAPKRIAFHAGALVLVKLLIIGIIFAYPMEAWLTPDIAREEARKVISLTNAIRAGLKIKPLKENTRLSLAAYAKAEDMLINDYFSHVSRKNIGLAHWLGREKYEYRSAGENLAMGFEKAEDAVRGWKDSRTHYANMIDRDFTEIGVGLASGLFDESDTTMVVQMFGEPAKKDTINHEKSEDNTLKTERKGEVKPVPLKSDHSAKTGLLGKKISEENIRGEEQTKKYATSMDTAAPMVDLSRSKLITNNVPGENKELVAADIYLSADTERAQLQIGGRFIELKEDGNDLNKWTAREMLETESDQTGDRPIVLANVTSVDRAGRTMVTDIPMENIELQKTSFLGKYLFLRTHQNGFIGQIFNISSIYYHILLSVLLITMIMNLFVEIRKQKAKAIVSSFGLLCLLVILIIV